MKAAIELTNRTLDEPSTELIEKLAKFLKPMSERTNPNGMLGMFALGAMRTTFDRMATKCGVLYGELVFIFVTHGERGLHSILLRRAGLPECGIGTICSLTSLMGILQQPAWLWF